MAKNSRSSYGFGGAGPLPAMTPLPIKSERNPLSSDMGFEIGSFWINTLTNNIWSLTSVINNTSNWIALSASADGNAPISKYVVDPDGSADYTTIQSALDAANAVGGNASIFIRHGTFVEDLTLYDTVFIEGQTESGTIIDGTHTPPVSGIVNFRKLTFQDSTAVFSSVVAGSATLLLEDCNFNVTNGYTFDLLNWTGAVAVFDIGTSGAADGVINNTGGATAFLTGATLGSGTTNTMIVSGNTTLENVSLQCPVSFQGIGTTIGKMGCSFTGTVTTSATNTVTITNSLISTGANAAISHGSANALTLSDVTINSSNNPAIIGAGAGNLVLGTITFLNNNSIAGALTQINTGRIISGGNIVVEGTNATSGIAILVAGTIVVSTTSVTANSRIQLTHQTNAGTPGFVSVTARVADTSFTITSSNGADTSDIAWLIIEPS